jgi:hypothetical protein
MVMTADAMQGDAATPSIRAEALIAVLKSAKARDES